jgi:hypothetical protein
VEPNHRRFAKREHFRRLQRHRRIVMFLAQA